MARTELVAMTDARAKRRGRQLAEQTRKQTESAIEQDADSRAAYAGSGLPPDWLTTGLAGAGAGWIFGPVGGLVGAAVSSILSKRRNDGIAVQAQADAETASSLIQGGEKSLKRLESTAETDEERLEVALLRDRYEAAVALAQNPDGQVAVEGFRELLALPGLLEGEADEIEQARIEANKRDQDRLQQEVTNLGSLADDYRQESQRFVDVRNSFAEVNSAFQEPNGAGDVRGVYTFLKMLDPGSTIMPGELALAENTGGASEALRGMYNKLLSGESLTPVQRRQLLNEAREAFENSQAAQLEINTRYMERGRASGIRPDLLRTLTVNTDPLNAASYRTPDPLGRERVNQVPEGAQVVTNDGTLSGVVDYWSQFGKEALQTLDQSSYAYDKKADAWYQTDVNGQTYRIPAPPPGFNPKPSGSRQPMPGVDVDPNQDGEVSALERLLGPEATQERAQRTQERMLRSPGLFQPGGAFGRELTQDEQRRRDELLNRQRAVNQ